MKIIFPLWTARGRSDLQPTRGDEKGSLHFFDCCHVIVINDNNDNNMNQSQWRPLWSARDTRAPRAQLKTFTVKQRHCCEWNDESRGWGTSGVSRLSGWQLELNYRPRRLKAGNLHSKNDSNNVYKCSLDGRRILGCDTAEICAA